MATLTESSSWTAGIYQLERLDLWDAGVSGAGIANKQAKDLANRTLWLKDEIAGIRARVHYQVLYPNQTIANNTVMQAKGSAYALAFPLSDWDYATPNDAIVREYIVTIGCTVGTGFTYSASAAVSMQLIRSTAGPTLVEIASCLSYHPGMTIMTQKKISLPANEKVIGIISVGNVGSAVPITNAFFRIEEVID